MRGRFRFETLLSPIDIKIAHPCRVDMRHERGSHRSDEPILGKLATRYTINNASTLDYLLIIYDTQDPTLRRNRLEFSVAL